MFSQHFAFPPLSFSICLITSFFTWPSSVFYVINIVYSFYEYVESLGSLVD